VSLLFSNGKRKRATIAPPKTELTTRAMAQELEVESGEPMGEVEDSMSEPSGDKAEANPTASILVVDDDPSQRLLMRKVLEGKGFAVIDAVDGIEACRLNEEHRPDLLLVDLIMPRMDGYELCRELRGQAHSADVPIVVTTSREDIPSIVRAYDAGATDFVPKPINWLVLSNRIRYILRASRAFADLRRNQKPLTTAQEAAEKANSSESEPVASSGEPRGPSDAMIGVSGMISDQAFGSLSGKATLSIDWAELDTIVTEIDRLQTQRNVAKLRGNVSRLNALSSELAAAMIERDRLVAQIGKGIGA
jgi:CheY-like chemotaxis protein